MPDDQQPAPLNAPLSPAEAVRMHLAGERAAKRADYDAYTRALDNHLVDAF